MSEQQQPHITRRGFLTAAACAPALAIAVLAARQASMPVVPDIAPPQPEPSAGYRETEHIRSYYRSAAF